jgi:GNAT superfamily N-acetyltransferase
MTAPELRPMTAADKVEVAELIYASINVWYRDNGHGEIRFQGGPTITEVFFETYDALAPGHVVAVNPENGRLAGSCFFHPRPTHVGLGIMNVHPNYFGTGVGKALLGYVCDFTDSNGYDALRLTSSALNLDSFALYSRAGFVARLAYQDMWLAVPEGGLGAAPPGVERVRDATADDAAAMEALELEIAAVSRGHDYAHAIANAQGFWHAAVLESPSGGGIDGYMISSGHSAMNIMGPCVTRTEEDAIALLARELDLYRGRTPLALVPVERRRIVEQMYAWGARISELHFCQVRGAYQPFRGVSMPTFMLETA